MSKAGWKRLRKSVIHCDSCPRLIQHCQQVAIEKRRSYQEQNYWGKPVPNFGELPARLLVVGLAPGAHGANRTGRMFTGDRSGEWLFRTMHRFGFANQPEASHRRDGLRLIDAVVTNVVRCAPPGNRPSREELAQCGEYFRQTLQWVDPEVIIALGKIAWDRTVAELVAAGTMDKPKRKPAFGHAARWSTSKLELIGSYHPSQQNTFTGRLTQPMFDRVFRRARMRLDELSK